MHKLVLAIDGSESASHALEYALKLAKENGPICTDEVAQLYKLGTVIIRP